MNARSRVGAAAACPSCGRPRTQPMGGVPALAFDDEAPPVVLVSLVQA